MQPGLSRAIPAGIIGFLLGSLIVIVIRGLQGMVPLWDTGVGMSLAAFTTAGFFVWGMGAFNPEMSLHGEAAEAAEAARAQQADNTPPRKILFGYTWQIATLLIIFLVAVFGFATIPGGLTLVTTADADASLTAASLVEFQLPGGAFVQVSQFVIFAIFIIITFVSLAAAASIINWVMIGMSRGVKEAQLEAAAAGGGTVAVDAPEAERTYRIANPTLRRLVTFVIFGVVFVVLYLLFYYVAIGLIAPQPDLPGLNLIFPDPSAQLVVLSFVNALVITFLILRPTLVLQFIGRVARFVVKILRRIPGFLQ